MRRVAGRADAPTLEQLAALHHVEACAHETMRLKPVAPLIGLQALRDTVVGDVEVPRGLVLINLMRRDSAREAHLPGDAAFRPQRWLGGGDDDRPGSLGSPGSPGAAASSPKRLSMPFGAGPRICPGRYLALLEIKLALAVLLGRFDIAGVYTADGRPPRELMTLTMNPVGLRLRERADA